MSFQKFKNNSYCVGGRHHSSTTNIVGDITIDKQTGKEIKLLIGGCSKCNRTKNMAVNDKTVNDDTIQAEGLGDFFKNFGKK